VETQPSQKPSESGYRPVSGLAVASLVAGVASALALVSPFFWVLPLFGLVIAVAGLVDTKREAAPKAGRFAAIAGLALSVGFGTQAVSYRAARGWIDRSRAEAVAEAWVAAVREGRLDDARSMCGPGGLPPARSMEPFGGPRGGDEEATVSAEEAFAAMPAVAALAACGESPPATLRLVSAGDTALPRWELEATAACGAGESAAVRIAVARDDSGAAITVDRWLVIGHELID
jgi:hypothetical protein